jgi:hypothetical protein
LCALMLRGGGLATRHVLRGREAHACQQHSGTDLEFAPHATILLFPRTADIRPRKGKQGNLRVVPNIVPGNPGLPDTG